MQLHVVAFLPIIANHYIDIITGCDSQQADPICYGSMMLQTRMLQANGRPCTLLLQPRGNNRALYPVTWPCSWAHIASLVPTYLHRHRCFASSAAVGSECTLTYWAWHLTVIVVGYVIKKKIKLENMPYRTSRTGALPVKISRTQWYQSKAYDMGTLLAVFRSEIHLVQ